jgi:hypothetical protein
MDFFLSRRGKFGNFIYNDPTDNAAVLQRIGVGDGSTTTFLLYRSLVANGFADPIACALTGGLGSISVYVDGVLQTSGITPILSFTNLAYAVQFSSAPAAAKVITASFNYYWPCHFTKDAAEFEDFAYQLWSMKELEFETLLSITSVPSPVPTQEADINFEYIDLPPTAGNFILIFTFGTTSTVPLNCAGSWASCQVAPTLTTIFDIARNGTNFATMTFAAGNNYATFAGTAQAFAATDVMTIVPRISDATISSISGFIATV